MDIKPRVLEGRHVRLEPLGVSHPDAFYEAAREWNLTREAVTSSIESALREQALGSTLPFATVDTRSGHVVGGTRLLHISPEHRRLEIFVRPDGQVHGAVIYSIVESEWPRVRTRLHEMLHRL